MKAKVPNAVLVGERDRRGWGRSKAAAELIRAARELDIGITTIRENVETQIKRCETGETAVPDQDYLTLFSHVYGKPSTELFGQHFDPRTQSVALNGSSHKLICGVVDASAIELLAKTHGLTEAAGGDGRLIGPVIGPDGQTATLHVWPCGAVICHLHEPRSWAGLAHLALWRYQTYLAARAWFTDHLQSTVGPAAFDDRRAAAVYVFSTYWVESSPWAGGELENGLRVLSMPSILLDRALSGDPDAALASARSAELSLLRDGVDREDLCCFSSPGAAIGYASWSGISYHPIVPARALNADRLVDTELSMQAAWAYSHDVLDQVKHGVDIDTWTHGLRYLRGARAQLSTSMPREDGQSRSMRAAIVQSSGVIPALDQAIDELRH